MIEALEKIGDAEVVSNKIASVAAPLILKSIQKSVSEHEAPDGRRWVSGKDGHPVYANAASKLTGAAHGNLVRVTLTGPEVYGNFGNSRLPERRMLPDTGAEIPKDVQAALDEATAKVMGKLTG
jgi:hypothetical protein